LNAAMEVFKEALIGKVIRGLRLLESCKCNKGYLGGAHDHLIVITDGATVELVTQDVEGYASDFDIYINGRKV